MDRQSFNWRLVHGLGTWLLDGLDEILERDNRFFDDLEDLMTDPSGRTLPSVVVFVRDSLFATHPNLNDFCAEYENEVAVYRLEPWQEQSKLEFASIKLGSQKEGKAFVQSLAERPAIDELASTPYYCELFTDEFAEDLRPSDDLEINVLEQGLKRIISRERDKGLLTGITDEGIREFVEFCAVTNLMEGGVPAEVAHEMAAVVMPDDVADDELHKLVTEMGQIALFSQGTDGNLRFAQEALEHYLA
ncbi:hypothetical protein [Candidatus Poriferisodalis sp.]|uniref:hypothetical protein n=1 Tax=Candidatus Poriferisodalis sp. TaxID=3101277 RepID=UPI003B5B7ABE